MTTRPAENADSALFDFGITAVAPSLVLRRAWVLSLRREVMASVGQDGTVYALRAFDRTVPDKPLDTGLAQ